MAENDEPRLGLATNTQLEEELATRYQLGHDHPDYRTSGYDGPVSREPAMRDEGDLLCQSEEYLISRTALNEAHSALAGCLAVLGNTANIAAALEQLRTARGNMGDLYLGHNPQFVIGGSSEPMPDLEPGTLGGAEITGDQ